MTVTYLPPTHMGMPWGVFPGTSLQPLEQMGHMTSLVLVPQASEHGQEMSLIAQSQSRVIFHSPAVTGAQTSHLPD